MKNGKITKGAFMKIGLIGLSVLFALLLCCNQNGFAASNILLNLNATGLTTVNQLYTSVSSKAAITALGWSEKVLYNMDGNVAAAVTNTVAGNIIVRVDVLATNATSGAITVDSYWLKKGTAISPFGGEISNLQLVASGEQAFQVVDTSVGTYGTAVDPATLTSLYLNEEIGTVTTVPAATTTSLISFPASAMQFPAQIIFTAILVDSIGQISGVDIKSMYFNWIGSAAVIKSGFAPPANSPVTLAPWVVADYGGMLWALGGFAYQQP